jgi:hypothetical protein
VFNREIPKNCQFDSNAQVQAHPGVVNETGPTPCGENVNPLSKASYDFFRGSLTPQILSDIVAPVGDESQHFEI